MDILTSLFGGVAIGTVLGLLGGGGALMAIPVLIYLFHYPFRVAVGSSLVLVAAGVIPALLLYSKKRQIDWLAALQMGIGGMLGAYGGSFLASFVQRDHLVWLLIGLMLLSAFNMLRPRPAIEASDGDSAEPKRQKSLLLLAGLGIGLLTGLVGVGGGFLLVPALLFFGGLPARQAIATSLVIIGLNALSGMLGYWSLIPFHSESFAWLVVGSLVGSVTGFGLSFYLSSTHLKRSFALLLLVLAVILLFFSPTR